MSARFLAPDGDPFAVKLQVHYGMCQRNSCDAVKNGNRRMR